MFSVGGPLFDRQPERIVCASPLLADPRNIQKVITGDGCDARPFHSVVFKLVISALLALQVKTRRLSRNRGQYDSHSLPLARGKNIFRLFGAANTVIKSGAR